MKKLLNFALCILFSAFCLTAISCSNAAATNEFTVPLVFNEITDWSWGHGTWTSQSMSVNMSQDIICSYANNIRPNNNSKLIWTSDTDIKTDSGQGEGPQSADLDDAKQTLCPQDELLKSTIEIIISAQADQKMAADQDFTQAIKESLLQAYNNNPAPVIGHVLTNENKNKIKIIITYNFDHDESNTHIHGVTETILIKH